MLKRSEKQTMDWEEAWTLFRSQDYSDYKGAIALEEPKSMMQKIFGCFSQGLENKHLPERETVYCLARKEISLDDEDHMRLLRGVFSKLSGENFCPAFGSHWKKVGFQSEDPTRDIRSTGVLGVLQVSSLIQRHPDWAESIYKHSIEVKFNYPFIVSQFSITKLCMEVFRTGKLNGYANGQSSFSASFDDLYCTVSLYFSSYYKKTFGIVSSYNSIMEIVEAQVKANPAGAVKKYKLLKEMKSAEALGAVNLD